MAVAVLVGALVLVLAAGASYQFVGTVLSRRRYPPPGRVIDVGGQRLHIVCAGSGRPAVLFESAIAASSLSWGGVLRDVAAFTRVCAYDRAGLGWSDSPRAPRTVARILGDLGAVLSQMAAGGRVVMVGHSFGAFVVCAYAAQHPADIAGLVLLDPPTEWQRPTREQARLLRGGRQLARIGGVLARIGVVRACLAFLTGGAPSVPRTVVRLFGPTAALTLERLVGEVRKLPPDVHPLVQALWCQPKCFRAMADHLGAFEETATAASRLTGLPDIPLVIVSSGDQSADVLTTHSRLARLSPRGEHIVAAKSGHWIQFDEPALVVAAIRDVVDRTRLTIG